MEAEVDGQAHTTGNKVEGFPTSRVRAEETFIIHVDLLTQESGVAQSAGSLKSELSVKIGQDDDSQTQCSSTVSETTVLIVSSDESAAQSASMQTNMLQHIRDEDIEVNYSPTTAIASPVQDEIRDEAIQDSPNDLVPQLYKRSESLSSIASERPDMTQASFLALMDALGRQRGSQ